MKSPLVSRRYHEKKLIGVEEKVSRLKTKLEGLKQQRGLLKEDLKRLRRFVSLPRQTESAGSFRVSNGASPLDASPLAYVAAGELGDLTSCKLSESVADLLAIPSIRHHIAKARWEVFLQSGASLLVFGADGASVQPETVAHNTRGITNSLSSLASLERSELVFRPVMALDRVYSYRTRSVFPELSVLLVGSRTEYEVLLALSYGIQPEKLSAVDLLSYSPWIQTGDMHALPFEDNTFDVLILGWTLGYSMTPERAAQEIARVCKPGAVVSIGNDCYTREALARSNFPSDNRPQTVKELLRCFDRHAGEVFFAHDPHYARGDIEGFTGHLIATFEIKK